MYDDLKETIVIATILFISIFGMMTVKMVYGDDPMDQAQARLAQDFHVTQQQTVNF